ncbi:hypothetical protein [Elizabethkingia anophelis]|uniref:Uncharacterized protein n=1 Tax=Elizabethkingia anophelis TaxID=1117645 RepID=A0A7Z7PVW3_9FLAO|nr:hypothetical protein [Elizabethkingia anophelis]AKH95417.1 hypothetical protein M876_12655 [Elizabethkingia anophelis FMS-007]WGL70580.1 hypothetical protein QFB79_04285 [Elizabethkingia anophelis]STC98369.1 Uncharacterised protein [Elizabethkingia anophelis]
MKHIVLSPAEMFLYNLAGQDDFRFLVLKTVLGYLLLRAQNPTTTKAVFFLDSNINELGVVNGGTGKSLLLLYLSYMRSLCQISGKDFNSTLRFIYDRVTEFTSIIGFNDMKSNIDFEHFFGRSTDGQLIERKYKQSIFIPYIYSPKLAFTSNYYPKAPSGNSTDRRLYVYEVSAYYSKKLTPKDEFGHSFFYDWDEGQWLEFDRLMISCVQLYLQHGLLEAPSIHLEQRKLISEVGTEIMEFLDEVLLTKTKLHKKELFADFRKESTASSRYQLSHRGFTIKVKKYLEYKGIPYKETPSDTKVFIEVITEEAQKKQSLLTINDIKTDYRTVDTANKMTRLVNQIQKFFSTDNTTKN